MVEYSGISQALQSSGWSGVILLLFCCLINIYTGIILGKTMDNINVRYYKILGDSGRVKDYSEIGEEAFGKYGKAIAQFSIYTTLTGVSIIFLVLIGILMVGIYSKVSTGFWTLTIGIVILTPIATLLKSYGEIKIISIFGFAATAVVVIVSVIMSFVFFNSPSYFSYKSEYNFSHSFFNAETFPNAFNIFTFAFGATAIFPNIFAKMEHKDEWPKAVIGGYSTALFLYAPIAIVGYIVYGSYLSLSPTILDAIQFFDKDTSLILKICGGVMVAHILSAFTILINPIFLAIERKLNYTTSIRRLILRPIIMVILIAIALFFPYFLSIMSLVSCISVSLSGYILPSLFYWKICNPHKEEKLLLIIVTLFGLVGSIVGIILSTRDLINNVKQNPNPFENLFHFG